MDEVNIVVLDVLGPPHEVVKQPKFWFCTACWWFSYGIIPVTADPPICPYEILLRVPWTR